MELRHLRYFCAVAELEHFHKAAERLCITQPALSNQIKQLENELSTKLFARSGRNVRLTESGEIVLDAARKILNEVDFLKETVHEVESGNRGSLKVGVLQSINTLYCRQLVTTFDQMHPHISLNLLELPNRDIEAGLLQGELDVGIGFIGNKTDNPPLNFELLFREEWKLITSRQNAVYGPAILNAAPHPLKMVLLSHGFETRSIVERYITDHEIKTNNITELNKITLIIDLVENGNAFSILPEAFAKTHTHGQIKMFDLKPRLPKREIGLLFPKQRATKRSVENFCGLVRDLMTKK
jgi:LysR family transcriptional regulator, cyn operon transcriptional activator